MASPGQARTAGKQHGPVLDTLVADMQAQKRELRKKLAMDKRIAAAEAEIPKLTRVERSKEFKYREKYQQKVSLVLTQELHEMIEANDDLQLREARNLFLFFFITSSSSSKSS